MATLRLPGAERYTHLQRAFKVFERMRQPLSARALAALMQVHVEAAYDYVKRLKESGCIEECGGTGKVPAYTIKPGASMPAGDRRGRKPRLVLEPELGGCADEELQPFALCASGTGR
jgi:hypothetical protein